MPHPDVMLLGHATLNISRPGQRDGVILIPSSAASRLRAAGCYVVLGPRDAMLVYEQFVLLNRAPVRAFAAAARLTTAHLRDLADHAVLVLVREGIRDGRIVGLRAVTPSSGNESVDRGTRARRALVRSIERRTRGQLDHEGRRYRLVVDVDLARMPERDRYEVVGREQARAVLQALACDAFADGELADLLQNAREHLSAEWRPPWGNPNGLVLLRRGRAAAAATHFIPVVTPSQLKALSQAGWIEIEFVDAAGRPLSIGCRLELPDCTPVESRGEIVSRHGFPPGTCTLSLPEIDGERWRLDG